MTPLSNIRVLDLSRLLPGPYASQLLADMGAEVIKIETPLLGDYARRLPAGTGGDTMFHMINRGKKSVGLNYRNRTGREIFLRLVESADVVLETFKPGSMDRWGIGYEAVRERNPGIIFCSISGYGQAGPYRDRTGHDINYIAIAGLLGLTGEPDSLPSPPAVQTADLSGATFAVVQILAALLERQQTGRGRALDVALMDPVVHWMMATVGSQFYGTGSPPRRGRLAVTGGNPCNRVYRTRDGLFLALGALEPPFWSEFCRLVARPDLLGRGFDETALPELEEIFLGKSLEEWLSVFSESEVPVEKVNDLQGMLEDPHVHARGLLEFSGSPGEAPQLNSPLPYPPAEGPAPALGADTQNILAEAGFSDEQLSKWAEKRIIKFADSDA